MKDGETVKGQLTEFGWRLHGGRSAKAFAASSRRTIKKVAEVSQELAGARESCSGLQEPAQWVPDRICRPSARA